MAAKLDESEAKADELDSGVLLFAERVLTKAGRLCSEFNLDQKQRLQRPQVASVGTSFTIP